MDEEISGLNCRLVIATLFLNACAFAGDFQISPDLSVDSLAVAGGSQEYLVVWRDVLGAQLRGSIVSNTGVAGASFGISKAGSQPQTSPVQRSTVAYDNVMLRYLVVWSDSSTAEAGIRGALISPQGQIIGGSDFLISRTSRSTELNPQVLFTGQTFIVAWQDNPVSSGTGGTQIFFSRLPSSLVPTNPVAIAGSGTTLLQSLEFLIAGAGGETLVVFQDASASPTVTRAVRVRANGTFVPSSDGSVTGTMLFSRDLKPTGFGVPIGGAYVDPEYIILSSHSAQLDSSVFKTRLQSSGVVIRPSLPFAEIGQATTGLNEDEFPRTFFNPTSPAGFPDAQGEFLFLRNAKVSATAYHILSARVTTDGMNRDPNHVLIDGAGRGVLDGAVAGTTGTQYLAVWMDGRNSIQQPASRIAVFGTLIDSTIPGDLAKPFIKANATASPVVGRAPMDVQFFQSGSTGIVDTIHWDFGDGGNIDATAPKHTYTSSGEFLAVIALIRAGFVMRDFVRITVDGDELGGAGGPPQTIGGVLGPVSSFVNTDIAIAGFTAGVNFKTPNADGFRFVGTIDVSRLPVLLDGVTGSLAIAGKEYPFTLTANGSYDTETGVTPIVRVAVNRVTGAFLVAAGSEELFSVFEPLGVTNETVAKPGRVIVVPFTFKLNTLQLDSVLTCFYRATAGKSGTVVYKFGSSGFDDTGVFDIFGLAAKEQGKEATTLKTHAFTLFANLTPGGGIALIKADTGTWRITLGNYIEDIPVGALTESKGSYRFSGSKSKVGIQRFIYSPIEKKIGISWSRVPAEGDSPSGMPIAASIIQRADMAFSVDFDVKNDGFSKFQGSQNARFFRNKQKEKKWKQR